MSVADQPRHDLRGGRPWVKDVPARLGGGTYELQHQLMPRGGIGPMPAITIPLS